MGFFCCFDFFFCPLDVMWDSVFSIRYYAAKISVNPNAATILCGCPVPSVCALSSNFKIGTIALSSFARILCENYIKSVAYSYTQ